MVSLATVSQWIADLKAGDRKAIQQLYERYFHRLAGLARKRLENMPRPGAADPEGAANSALASFWRRLEKGQFPSLFDENDLWNLLARITVCKAARQMEREFAQKRGGGAVHEQGGDSSTVAFEQVLSDEPAPELLVDFEDHCQHLLGRLDDTRRQVVQLRLEGYSNAEIAGKLGRGVSFVESTLALIRRTWATEFDRD